MLPSSYGELGIKKQKYFSSNQVQITMRIEEELVQVQS